MMLICRLMTRVSAAEGVWHVERDLFLLADMPGAWTVITVTAVFSRALDLALHVFEPHLEKCFWLVFVSQASAQEPAV